MDNATAINIYKISKKIEEVAEHQKYTNAILERILELYGKAEPEDQKKK